MQCIKLYSCLYFNSNSRIIWIQASLLSHLYAHIPVIRILILIKVYIITYLHPIPVAMMFYC